MNLIHVVGLVVTAFICSYIFMSGVYDWRAGNKKRAAIYFSAFFPVMLLGMFVYHFIALLAAV